MRGAEVTRFKGLGEINPKEFGQFIFPRKEGESEDKGMHLTPVSIQSLKNVPEVLKFYMGKNTPERRDFIDMDVRELIKKHYTIDIFEKLELKVL